jgi:biotin-(acetyl-CoA carboxylase) ligase
LLLKNGNRAITERWEAASTFAHGKRVRVSNPAGETQGTTAGIDPSGALKIQYDDGRQESLVAGEVVEVK